MKQDADGFSTEVNEDVFRWLNKNKDNQPLDKSYLNLSVLQSEPKLIAHIALQPKGRSAPNRTLLL